MKRHPEERKVKLARKLLISGPGTFPGPLERPFYRENNRSSIFDAFVSHFRIKLAGEEGFEPSLTGSEPAVLPLDDSPVSDVTEPKIRPLKAFLRHIIPLVLPQKRQKTVKLLQSQLYSFLPVTFHRLGQLCSKKCKSTAQKSQFLKCQPAKRGAAGILFASTTRAGLYNLVADNGNETIPLVAPPTLRETIPRSADETDTVMAPLRCRDLLRRWYYAN